MSRSHEREDGNMGDGTPSESDMRDVYTGWAHPPMDETEAGDEFDRFVSKIKADAWDEGRSAGHHDRDNYRLHHNPYR